MPPTAGKSEERPPGTGVLGSGRLADVRILWLLLLNGIGAAVAVASQILDRDMVNEDGLSYLEMGLQAAQGSWTQLLNLYWSPLYPASLALGFTLVRPEPAHTAWVAHGVNATLAMCASAACSYFIWNWLRLNAGPFGLAAGSRFRFCCLATFIYCLFLYSLVRNVAIATVTPDLMVMAIALLAAGWCCSLALSPPAAWRFAVLGVILGTGYLAKAAMLPIGIAFLAVTFLCLPGRGIPRRYLLFAALGFGLTAAPQLWAMSRAAGRFSFGESGRLNLAWFVDGVRAFAGWPGPKRGQVRDEGTPAHPPRMLCDQPLSLEFGSPVLATYPLWYAPAYWHEGIKARFPAWRTMRGVVQDRAQKVWMALTESPIWGWGLCAMLLLRLCYWRDRLVNWRTAWLLGWGAAGAAVYLPVYVEPRFLGAPFVFFWVAVYSWLFSARAGRYQQLAMCVAAMLAAAPQVSGYLAGAPRAIEVLRGHGEYGWPERAARELHSAGLERGQPIATVGYSFDAHWAHVAGVRIVAQVLDDKMFWSLPPARRLGIEELLRRAGAAAIASKKKTAACDCPEWREVGTSGMLLRQFSPDDAIERLDAAALRAQACEWDPNLLDNGRFEGGIEGWDGGRGEVKPAGGCHTGSCLEFIARGTGSQYAVRWGAVRLEPGKEYVLSAWLKAQGNEPLPLECGIWDGTVSRWVAKTRFTATAEWRQMRLEFRNDSPNAASPIFWESLDKFGVFHLDEVVLLERSR